jgi:hypothetical protein
VNTGIKTQILSGLEHQRAIHDEVLMNLSVTHPVGPQLSRLLLQLSCAFVEFIITALDNVWSEYLSIVGDIQPDEAFLVFCASMRRIFREFRKVCQHDATAIQRGSVAQRVGTNWWYALQTHWKMAEFLQVGFNQHTAITPVFTAHLDRHRVSKTSFATLETCVQKVKTDMAAIQTSVNHLNGTRVTVEDASLFLDCNRERVTTLHKKRESKQQRSCSTITRNIQQPTEPLETSVQRTG